MQRARGRRSVDGTDSWNAGRGSPEPGYRAALSTKPRELSANPARPGSRLQKRRPASATGMPSDARTTPSGTPEPLNRPSPAAPAAPTAQSEEGVKVVIRVRPFNQNERLAEDCTRCITCIDGITLMITPDKKRQRSEEACNFTFDSVMEECTQVEVFQEVGVPIIENVIEGYNSTIFAYGQTGAGKTHTMIGNSECGRKTLAEEGGLAPRVFQYLFQQITEAEQQTVDEYGQPQEVHFNVQCSVIEIYNENITDLLNPKEFNLQIREDAQRGAFVDGLTEVHCQNAHEALQVLFLGAQNRRTAHTKANSKSSRSHYIYTCMVDRTAKSMDGVCQTRHSRLNLVDLAGSERNNMSGAANHQLKEACHINKSLSTLGRVIKELLVCQKHGRGHIPYRDSKLTYLLQESLGGNAKTTIIANISPASMSYHETLSTLQFVRRAKYIRNNARVNEESEEKQNIADLSREVKRLKEVINNLREQAPAPVVVESTELKEQIEDLQRQLDAEKEAKAALVEENEDLQRQLDAQKEANAALVEEKQKFQDHVARLQGDRSAMRKSIDLLMRKVNDAHKSFETVEELGEKVSATEKEVLIQELRKEGLDRLQSGELMDDMMRELERARDTMERQQEEMETMYKADAQKDACLAAANQQLAREKDASAGLEAALDRTRAELIVARDGVSMTKGEMSKKEIETEALRQKLMHMSGDLSAAEREISRLKEQLDNKAAAASKLDCTVAELTKLIKDTKDEAAALIEDREQENDYLRHLLDDATSRVDAAESTLAQISIERDQMRRANFSLFSFMDNIGDVIRDTEVSTPMGMAHTIRRTMTNECDFDERHGYDLYERPSLARSVTPKYAMSPDGLGHKGVVDFISLAAHPVEVGGYGDY